MTSVSGERVKSTSVSINDARAVYAKQGDVYLTPRGGSVEYSPPQKRDKLPPPDAPTDNEEDEREEHHQLTSSRRAADNISS